MGSLFCWVFFPFFNVDIPSSLILNYTAGLNTFYCISACVVTTVSLTCMINGKIDLRDIIYSTVAGGVAVGSSAAIIDDSLSALLLGVGAAIIHVSLFQLEKVLRWIVVVENYVFYLFAVLGACGGLVSAIFVTQSRNNSSFTSITYSGYVLPAYWNQFIGVGISAAMGLAGGAALAPLICLLNV
jgi:ammonia channel protein AmtB